jgi:signal transduction histidine kinase
MFRSIRWRLVISYLLLALLTVSLVGVLTLSLVKRYVEQRSEADLKANAEAVARQAAPLMSPVERTAALAELARTAAFVGGVRVRILDARNHVVADSGAPTGVDLFMWFNPSQQIERPSTDQSWIVVMPSGVQPQMRMSHAFPLLQNLPEEVQWTIVNRIEGVWGNRFSFEGRFGDALTPAPDVTYEAPGEPELKTTAPRSKQVIAAAIGDEANPTGYVELSGGPNYGAEALATTRRAFLFAAGGAMGLAVLVGLLVSHGLTSPLRSLTATARAMGEDLAVRASVEGQDEIGLLGRQLNTMAERLEASFAALRADRDTLRRFVADASHELRTPITALKSFNELLQGAAVDDPEAREEFLAESAVQLERLEWITGNLLDLSRLDAGLAPLALDDHDVEELLVAASGAFGPLVQDKGVELAVFPPASPLTLRCDRARVEMALSNLLDNAFKYVLPGGRIEVGADEKGEAIRFWVRDTGPGIDPADLPYVFERFYRGRGGGADGSGLGLAIVHSVVRAHGGRAGAESEPGEGSFVWVEIPRRGRQEGAAAV